MIRFFALHPVLTHLLFFFFAFAGYLVFLRIPLESFPSMSFGLVLVVTEWPGASAEDVEKLVSRKIEDALADVDDVLSLKSISTHGLSRVQLKFDEDLSDDRYHQLYTDVQNEINKITDLPEAADTPLVLDMDTDLYRPTLSVAVGGSLPEIAKIKVAKELREVLRQVPGVNKVTLTGQREQEIHVRVQRELAERYGLSLLEIVELIRRDNQNLPGGSLETRQGEILIRTEAEFQSLQHLGKLIVVSDGQGHVIRLGDIAQIEWAFENWLVMDRMAGQQAVVLTCVKEKNENALEVVPRLKVAVEEYRQQKAPSGITFAYFRDSVTYIRRILDVLKSNLTLGSAMVFLLLWIGIGLGNALLAIIGIPFSFLCALCLVSLEGGSINEVLLISMVLVSGMVVDDAIIILENIQRRHQEGESLYQAAIEGAREVFWPVIAATATTVATFLPMLIMSGITGKIMAIIPKTITFTLLASLAQAFIVLPCHYIDRYRLFHGQRAIETEEKAARGLVRQPGRMRRAMNFLYAQAIRFTVEHRYFFVIGISVVMVGSLFLMLSRRPIPIALFPSDFQDFWVNIRVQAEASIEQTAKKVEEVEAIVAALPAEEILTCTTQVGEGIDENYEVHFFTNIAQITVTLNPNRRTGRTADEIIQDLQERIDRAPLKGFENIATAKMPNGPQQGKPVAVRIRGEEMEPLLQLAELVKNELREIKGAQAIEDNVRLGKQEAVIQLREEMAKRYHLSHREIAQTVAAAIHGLEASEIQGIEDSYTIRVRYDKEAMSTLADIERIKIKTPAGAQLELRDVAHLHLKRGLASYDHYDRKRCITITAAVDSRLTTSTEVNRRLQQKIEPRLKDFPGYLVEYGGEYEETQKSFQSLYDAFFIGLFAIYLILAGQFNSFWQPFLIMSIIPFSLVGVAYGLWFLHFPFTMLTFIGTVGLAGVVVNDSIVLIDFINQSRAQGTPLLEAVISSSQKRLRPILLTTVTTVAGLLPLSLGIGGSAVTWAPMATAFCWGLSFSTILTLFIIPALYMILVDFLAVADRLLRRLRK